MVSHSIIGGGGLRLHVRESGNPNGRPVLFVHGYSQSHLSWIRQLQSASLGGPLRLLAMDLRGHGLSEKRAGVYGDSKLWADDVHAVITELGLDRPVLSGWSYGGLVLCDYVRFHGDAGLSGLQLVGALTKLAADPAAAQLSAAFLAQTPALTSTDVETNVAAVRAIGRLAVEQQPTLAEAFTALGYTMIVPPHVRAALLDRTVDNDDVLTGLSVPVLITHGADDRIVPPAVASQHAALVPHAELSIYPGVGHVAPVENFRRFNRDLRRFALGTS